MPEAEEARRETFALITSDKEIPYPSYQTVAKIPIDSSRAGAFRASRLHVFKEGGDGVYIKLVLNGSDLIPSFLVSENTVVKSVEGPGPDAEGILELQIKRIMSSSIPKISSSFLELIK